MRNTPTASAAGCEFASASSRRRNDEAHLARSYYEPLLAKLWHKTGCAYRDQGRHERAVACFRKALQYQPTKLKSWLRLVMEGSRLGALRRCRLSRPNAGRLKS